MIFPDKVDVFVFLTEHPEWDADETTTKLISGAVASLDSDGIADTPLYKKAKEILSSIKWDFKLGKVKD